MVHYWGMCPQFCAPLSSHIVMMNILTNSLPSVLVGGRFALQNYHWWEMRLCPGMICWVVYKFGGPLCQFVSVHHGLLHTYIQDQFSKFFISTLREIGSQGSWPLALSSERVQERERLAHKALGLLRLAHSVKHCFSMH